ncbi:dihydrofolate reductase family protein [Streptomyces sp. NBC_00237]|uniref:dihydrofolate reductase family protein n=1 Tax=Streptomyces sp. NBC_00237 TaxID=2975687 RepID=UPI0022552CF3|nr:dihydrofolate reductase family protein [Streptomyces sp. NBC_00237]MCX5204291.1 dihydrofolate reductase family protein [Streptomyces sp. NBC_00237]
MRKLTYYVAASLDGFIGHPDTGDGAFFEQLASGEYHRFMFDAFADTLPTLAREHFGIADKPLTRFDTVIQGRKSNQVAYDQGVTSPYAHLRQYVASRTLAAYPDPSVELIRGDLVAKVRELKAEDGELGIYLCGGGEIAGQLIDEIDELIIKTYPLLVGSGVPMASAGFGLRRYELTECRTFDNGAVVTTYRKAR